MPQESLTELEFVDETVGMNIPKNFIPSIEKVTVTWNCAFQWDAIYEYKNSFHAHINRLNLLLHRSANMWIFIYLNLHLL